MSEDAQTERLSGKPLSRAVIAQMLGENFRNLPDIDQKLFMYGPMYLGMNAGFVGLISNSLFRRAMNVTRARVASSLPMAALPCVTAFALYNAAISSPLITGEISCPTCILMRGALVGALGGGLYPILLAFPVNMGLASVYQTALLPEKGAILKFFMDTTRPVLNKLRAAILLQALFGTYLSSRNFQSYSTLAHITFQSGGEAMKKLQD